MAQSRILCIGMAVHTESIAVAYIAQDYGAEVTCLDPLGTRQCDIDPRVRQRPATATHLLYVYEPGPCEYWRYRYLRKKADDCGVVAPSLLPKKAGERGKTARRDAVPLARLARSGDRTLVSVPTVDEAAMRDLTRARDDALSALTDATRRLTAVLLRHELRSTGQATWNAAHRRWLSAVVCPPPAQHSVCQAYGRAIPEHTARLQRLDEALQARGTAWRLHLVGAALPAWRGIQCTVAVTTVAALGALPRFDPPRARRTFFGRIPSAYSSGERRRQGAMTNAGHPQARRVLVAGAGASRYPAQVRRPLPRSLAKHPKALQDRSWTAQVRRCTRYRHLLARGQHANQVGVAMARALVGCMGAIAKAVPVALEGHTTAWSDIGPHASSV